jgi:predicted metal-dependent phosphoesterase TrpH
MSIEQFYKCDFHVHSYNDKATPNAGNSMGELSKNINESDIDCFAITDHNIFPADFFNELSKQISKDKVLFPGIELNMTISDQGIHRS